MATMTMTLSSSMPPTMVGLRLINRRRRGWPCNSCTWSVSVFAVSMGDYPHPVLPQPWHSQRGVTQAPLIANARVQKCVHDVHQQVDQHVDPGKDQDDTLDDRIVPVQDGIYREPA